MKVLIVDDNSENLYLLESILKGSGYITISANNGAEALDLARKDIPDLIITDILMPVMDGFTLCREFKNDEKLCSVPFIFYTATYSDPRDEEFALNLGADRFILKPQDPEEFIAIVKELLKEEKKQNIKKTEAPSIPETVILKEYNEVLVRKLEAKMLKLEQSEKEIRKNNNLLLKEIEERKLAENTIEENEKFLKETQKIAQLGSYTLDVNTGIWNSSEILDAIFGIESDYDKSVEGWTLIIHPEWKRLMADYFANEVVGLRKSFDKEYKIVRKSDKTERWVHGLGELVIDKENRPIKMIGTIRDITELKNAEQEIVNLNRVYALLSNTNEAIVRIKDRQKLFDEICRIAIDHGKFRMAWIGIVNNDTNKVDVKASAGLIENFLEEINLDLSNEIRSEGPTGKAVKNGTNIIANDIEIDKNMLPWKENALRLGYKSCAAFPLSVFGKAIGVFSIYASQKDFFHLQEISLLDEMAMDISFTLEFLETEKNRKAVEENLQISEERFRSLYENSTIGLYRTTPDGKILLANPTLVKLLGYSSFEELASKDLNKDGFKPDYDRRLFIDRIDMDGEVKGFESAWTRNDGTTVYVLESAKAILDSKGQTLYYDGSVEDITKRRIAQDALKESELRFKQISDYTEEWIWEVDKNGLYTYSSPIVKNILGYELEELVGKKHFYDFFDPEIKEDLKQAALGAFTHKESFRDFVNCNIHKDGRKIILSTSGVPLLDKESNLIGYRGVDVDITERKRAEDELLASKLIIEGIIDSIPVRVFWKDKNLVYLGCNTIFAADAGFSSPLEIIGKDDYQMGWRDQAELYREDDRNVIESGKSKLHIEEPQTTPEGKTITLLTSKIPLRDSKGEITGLLGTYIDITDRKLAEEKLQESEERFRVASESLTDIIYDWDIKEKIDWYGDIDGLMGYSPGEFPRTLDAWAVSVHPEDKDRVWAALESHLKGVAPYIIEYRIARRDGELRWWSVRGIALRNDRGEPYKMIGSITDITERKLSADALHTSEAKFRSYIDYSPQGIFVVNAKGQYIDANEAALNQIGCSKEYLLQKTIADILPKEELEKGLNHFNKLVKEGNSTGEFRLLKINGEQINVILDTVKISDDRFLGFSTNITNRKQAEEALRDSEERYRSLIQSADAAIVTADSKRTIIDWNKGAEKIFGYLKTEITGEKLDIIMPPGYLENHIKGMKRIEQGGEHHIMGRTVELQGFHKDGKKIPIELSLAEWETSSKKYFTGIIRDITERKGKEKEIVMLANALRSVDQCVSITDMDDKIIFINQSFLRTYGYREDEIIGKDMSVFRSQKNPPALVEEILPSTLSGGWNGELWNKRKDGSELLISLTTRLIEDKDDKFFGLIGVASDITERKLVEKALNESEKKFRSVWEKRAEGMRITNQAGEVVMVNDAYCKLMEKPLDDIEGKLMSVVHEETRQVEILFKHEEQFHTRNIPSYLEKEITLWNGNKIFVEVLSTFLEIENQSTLLLSIFKDISDRKRTESELIAAKEKAEEMNRLKSNFLANMSHELRTPLVGILGFADILRQEVESQETKAMADTIYKSGKRLSETLNLILDLSKFESEKWDIKHSKIDLVSKTEEVIDSFEGTASKKGLTLKSSFSQNSIIINFEDRAFHSILNNLINNALKFTSEGSVTTTILLNNDFVEIKVIDTGIGIAEQDYQIIFEEFRQASEGYNRNFEGSGLGLSITKKLVEKFGGTITVESEIGKGSTFTVIFPVTNAEAIEKEQTANVSKIIPKSPVLKSVKPIALLVDDDPFVFTVLKRYASEYMELETTVDADFAIKMLRKKQYDLIFMDINLRRGMDGKEATKKIRTMKGYASIPIIATTAYAMLGDKEEFLATGCTHYLSKPFSQEDIVSLLEDVIKLV